MRRRTLLGLIGSAGAVTTSGCGMLETECGPADTPLGEIGIDRDDYADDSDRFSERSFTVRGAVVYETILGVIIDDGTGLAELVPRHSNEEINRDVVDVGDCLEGSGPLNLVQTAKNEMPDIGVRSLDGKGTAKEYEPLEDHPFPRFDADYDRESEESVFEVVGGDPIRAGNLVVRWRHYESEGLWTEADRARWHELADVGPAETVPQGSAVRFSGDQIEVSMLWQSPDRPWSREVKTLAVGKMY